MWPRTRLAELLRVEYPILQAPMAGGPTTPELVAAVSNAGALGAIGGSYLSGAALREQIHAVRALTDRPFGVNLFAPTGVAATAEQIARAQALVDPYRAELGLAPSPEVALPVDRFAEGLAVVLEERVPVFSFTFGIPPVDDLRRLRESGTVVIGTATTVVEGMQLEAAGVDVIVGQGSEAGGHRGTFAGDFERGLIGTVALVPQLVDSVSVPVVAAGGIMDGRGIAAALALGAVGVQMGTAFLVTRESGAHPKHKAAVLASGEDNTTVTRVFSGKAARALANRFTEELRAREDDAAPYPVQNVLTQDVRRAAARQDRTEFLALWSGQAPRLARPLAAGELVRTLVEETERVLGSLGARA